MVQAGMEGLNTPRTEFGDATYVSRPDFDITQEQSFQSPSNDNNNLIQQLQNGRRGLNLKTPRSRVALGDRRNLPAGLAGGEFTPLLKSATRNSTRRNKGKENVPATPAFLKGNLENISEDISPLPTGSSIYGQSRNGSYLTGTPVPQIDSSGVDTPIALLPRRNDGPGVLQDGNQMSLREQESVIDKIEKENFGLKLKIHFLEEALRKAGPGFSEAALKENTELKVDKVTMQKELLRYKKTLQTSERDMELFRQQYVEMQDKAKRKQVDQGQREELERVQCELREREAEIQHLKSQASQFEDMQEKVQDLEADLRQKDRELDDRDDEVENLKEEVEKRENALTELENAVKQARREAVELEEKAQASEELEDARATIEDLEEDLKRLRQEAQEAKEERQEALNEKERAEADLDEMQDELANKSAFPKGLHRQLEEKADRLQDNLDELRRKHTTLEEQDAEKARELRKLQDRFEALKQEAETNELKLKDKLALVHNEKERFSREGESASKRNESLKRDLQTERERSAHEVESAIKRAEVLQKEHHQMADEKNLLQIRHDALTSESASLQKDLVQAREAIEDLQDKLDHEKTVSLNNERQVRDEYKTEIDRLHDEMEDLRAEIREKERLYDDDNDNWDNERQDLETQRDNAEEKCASLQRACDRLQALEGSLSSKETTLKYALQIEKERFDAQEGVWARKIKDLEGKSESLQHTIDRLQALEGSLSGNEKKLQQALQSEKDKYETQQAILVRQVMDLESKSEGLQRTVDRLQAVEGELSGEERKLQQTIQSERRQHHEQEALLLRQVSELKQKSDTLQRSIDRMQVLEGTLSGKEIKMQQTMQSEMDRHQNQEAVLLRQISELQEKSNGLQRTIDRNQMLEGSHTSNEQKLQQAIETEQHRRETQEALLSRQITELEGDVERWRRAADEARSSLASVKEELRMSQREQKSLAEKAEELEDEVDVLQICFDEKSDEANREISAAKKESESLRRQAKQEVTAATNENKNLHRQLQALNEDLARARTAEADARAEMQAFQGSLRAGEGNNEQLCSRLRDVEAQLARVRQERQSLQEQIAALNIELRSLRTSKDDVDAERDDLRAQLKAANYQVEETFRLDRERVDVRSAKRKLESSLRRLHEENTMVISHNFATQSELQAEINRATAEENRLNSMILDLQRILRGEPSEKKELALAKKTIYRLESRVRELEIYISTSPDNADATQELSMIRHDISAARQKETEYLKREAIGKEKIRNLKRQAVELERKLHDADVSQLVSSPNSSVNGSARRSEIIEVRAQLQASHITIKEIRTQLKQVEKDAKRKVNAINVEIEARTQAWASEKQRLERAVEEAQIVKGTITAKNASTEATVTRLRTKVGRLEKALEAERLNSGEGVTIVDERKDLHNMLRETQVQAESLEIQVQEQEKLIAMSSVTELELRSQLKRLRDVSKAKISSEIAYLKTKEYQDQMATMESNEKNYKDQVANIESKYRELKKQWKTKQTTWEEERHRLTQSVRFANESISENEAVEAELAALKVEVEHKEYWHMKTVRGLAMQLEFKRSQLRRLEDFNKRLIESKKFMKTQIDKFNACNKAQIDLFLEHGLLEPGGSGPQAKTSKKTIRSISYAIILTIRAKKESCKWAEARKVDAALIHKIAEQKALGWQPTPAIKKALIEVGCEPFLRADPTLGKWEMANAIDHVLVRGSSKKIRSARGTPVSSRNEKEPEKENVLVKNSDTLSQGAPGSSRYRSSDRYESVLSPASMRKEDTARESPMTALKIPRPIQIQDDDSVSLLSSMPASVRKSSSARCTPVVARGKIDYTVDDDSFAQEIPEWSRKEDSYHGTLSPSTAQETVGLIRNRDEGAFTIPGWTRKTQSTHGSPESTLTGSQIQGEVPTRQANSTHGTPTSELSSTNHHQSSRKEIIEDSCRRVTMPAPVPSAMAMSDWSGLTTGTDATPTPAPSRKSSIRIREKTPYKQNSGVTRGRKSSAAIERDEHSFDVRREISRGRKQPYVADATTEDLQFGTPGSFVEVANLSKRDVDVSRGSRRTVEIVGEVRNEQRKTPR